MAMPHVLFQLIAGKRMSNVRCIIFLILLKFNFNFTLKYDNSKYNEFHKLPRFWTNTGFCPMVEITNSQISGFLMSDDVRTNLELIGALPNKGISSIRIHWILQLVDFVQFLQHKRPEYDFTKLDEFLNWLDEAQLSIGFEFMGNPSKIFTKNTNKTEHEFLWEDLTFQIVQRYLKRFGIDKVLKWKFETWNEPDLKTYNLLNFTDTDYLNYIKAVKRGLAAAGRTARNLHIPLRGPAGLFKDKKRHKLCWSVLEECNKPKNCYFDVLTFHRKGQGEAEEVLLGGKTLIDNITSQYPNLKNMKISNDEADPIAGWSTPRNFQSDVHYATILTSIIFQHWNAMLNIKEYKHLESISHDNAFLSYHPYEFDQRTLLARFRMNLTQPPHTQYIQKPVYAALGLLGNLATYARPVEMINSTNITFLITSNDLYAPFYSAIVVIAENGKNGIQIDMNVKKHLLNDETLSYIIEGLETDITDPVKIWSFYGRPSYPNSTVRELMRKVQTPKLFASKVLKLDNKNIKLNLPLRAPWMILGRICSSLIKPPFQPQNLRIRKVNEEEVLIIWSEIFRSERCLKTYEVYFLEKGTKKWKFISEDWHLPFLSFHYHSPKNRSIKGLYKVRGIDMFIRQGEFSETKLYQEY